MSQANVLVRGLIDWSPAMLWPLGLRRRVVDGQTLDRQLQVIVRLQALLPLPEFYDVTLEEARAGFEDTTRMFALPARKVRIEEREAPTDAGPLRLRVYWPNAPAPRPALVYYHGGGWVLGSLESHDGVCRALAARAGCCVVAVDYRLAPEHPFPAALDDARAAFRWTVEQADALGIDPSRVAVGGDSAGGTLAAVVSQLERDPGPALQLLVYPATDLSREAPSYEHFGAGFLLTRETMTWFKDHYLPDVAQRSDPRASPLLAEDLSGQPPVCLLTAGFDVLRDEGLAYADRLRAAGVQVESHCFRELTHGYFSMSRTLRAARPAFDVAVNALRRLA